MKVRDFISDGSFLDVSRFRVAVNSDGTSTLSACIGDSIFSQYLREFPTGLVLVVCEVAL